MKSGTKLWAIPIRGDGERFAEIRCHVPEWYMRIEPAGAVMCRACGGVAGKNGAAARPAVESASASYAPGFQSRGGGSHSKCEPLQMRTQTPVRHLSSSPKRG